jgi:acyl-CoA thioesterase-1
MTKTMKRTLLLTLGMIAALIACVPALRADDEPEKKLSASLRPIEDVPGLPRVLLIGDSISIGYTVRVRKALEGRANLHRPPTNCGSTASGLGKIDEWLGKGKWDVIHFNWGLHDLKYLKPGKQNVPPAKYEANLTRLVKRLKQTGATLIWATTTPVPEKVKSGYARQPKDVDIYNEIALRVMKKHGVRIDDLHAVVQPDIERLRLPENVHYTSKGYDALAKSVTQSIEAVLKP